MNPPSRPLAEPHVQDLIPYVPGKPIEETEREYGVTNIAKLASNENCLGPSPLAKEAAARAVAQMHLYPDAGAYYLKERLAQRHADHGITPANLVVGNGTNELLVLLVRAFLGAGEVALNAWPSFVVYRLAVQGHGRAELQIPLDESLGYDLDAMAQAAKASDAPVKLAFVANPNNPTGRYIDEAALDGFVGQLDDDTILVLDEAYAEYVREGDYPDGVAWVKKRPRTVVTRTFSKAFGLAALRVGYAICDPAIADILNRLRDPFNVNAVGQQAALAALDDTDHVQRSVAHNTAERARVSDALQALGMEVTPSVANFVLATLPGGGDMAAVYDRLLHQAVIIRPMKGYGLPRSARITIGTVEENDRLLSALGGVLGG